MSAREFTAEELDAHKTWHTWVRSQFKTRYHFHSKGNIYELERGRIGVRFNYDQGSHLVFRTDDTLPACWFTFCTVTTLPEGTRFHNPWKWALMRNPLSLSHRIGFYRAHKDAIARLAHIEGDLRAVANLTLMLEYKIPPK